MNNKNLISLADRTEEERKEIARLGGLARQKQRRERLATKKRVEAYFNSYSIINEYIEKPKHIKSIYNSNLLKNPSNYINNYIYDLIKTLELIEKEEEIRKKELRKAINRRYYLKRKGQKPTPPSKKKRLKKYIDRRGNL